MSRVIHQTTAGDVPSNMGYESAVTYLEIFEFSRIEQHNLTADGGARSDEQPNLPNNSRSTIFTSRLGRSPNLLVK
ncbi:hypothetical protein DdX_06346 [Ditylenchus destructor]|uniref:Uncharacterized protein n=1 Tax=Ditylenchus destructor TaxID=166010 RepID=A0AAD4R8R5_9BILA|nr:hypothetical protein DdX_06346 [Ditylenchus destructor]